MSYSSEVLADSPALYWRLGETTGTNADDATANNRDGTYVGSPTLGVAGPLSGDADTAVDFNGSTQWVTSAYNPFTQNTVRTFEAWIWRDVDSNWHNFLGGDAANSSTVVMVASSDELRFSAKGSVSASFATSGVGTARWAHVVVTFNDTANTVDAWVDGVAKTQVTGYTDQFHATPGNFMAAPTFGTGIASWNGKIDEVAVYEGALTTARVQAHYQAASITDSIYKLNTVTHPNRV